MNARRKEETKMSQKRKGETITLLSFPKSVRPAVSLLGGVAEKALEGVGGHVYENCPIAKAYGVHVPPWWRKYDNGHSRDRREQEILTQAGWNQVIYDAFMDWYDKSFGTMLRCSKRRENLLRAYLEQRVDKVKAK